MKHIVIFTVCAVLLGGCSTVGDGPAVTAALGDSEIAWVNSDITPGEDKNRLIDVLSKIRLSHHKDALREIEQQR